MITKEQEQYLLNRLMQMRMLKKKADQCELCYKPSVDFIESVWMSYCEDHSDAKTIIDNFLDAQFKLSMQEIERQRNLRLKKQ